MPEATLKIILLLINRHLKMKKIRIKSSLQEPAPCQRLHLERILHTRKRHRKIRKENICSLQEPAPCKRLLLHLKQNFYL